MCTFWECSLAHPEHLCMHNHLPHPGGSEHNQGKTSPIRRHATEATAGLHCVIPSGNLADRTAPSCLPCTTSMATTEHPGSKEDPIHVGERKGAKEGSLRGARRERGMGEPRGTVLLGHARTRWTDSLPPKGNDFAPAAFNVLAGGPGVPSQNAVSLVGWQEEPT